MKQNTHFKLEDVDKLSRGKRTSKRIGSRAVGHHLYAFEREEYERASKCGFVTINHLSRSNLWNLWQKATQARKWPFLVLLKRIDEGKGDVYVDDECVFSGSLQQAKIHIKALAIDFV